jgi:hypothetical protein
LKITIKNMSHRGSLPLAVVALAATAHAQILGVANSSVRGTFTSQNGNFVLNSNPGPFTFPGSQIYAATDWIGAAGGNQALNSSTFAYTAITGGFVVGRRGNVNSTFVLVPQTSYLQQGPAAVGLASLTLNFTMTYNVGVFGVAGGVQTAGYQLFGNIGPGLGDFGRLSANLTYSKVGGGVLGALGLDSGNITRATPGVNPLTGAFNFPLNNAAFINGFAGAGQLQINGFIKWQGDPSTIEVGAQATPEPAPVCALGLGVLLVFRRRRAKK